MERSLKRAIYAASYGLPFVAALVMALWLRHAAQPSSQPDDPACLGLYDDTPALRGEVPIEPLRDAGIARLLAVRARCLSDPYFFDLLARLMIEAGRGAELRARLEAPDTRSTLPADVIRLQLAQLQLAEAAATPRAVDAGGNASLRAEALATARDLMGRWPDWQPAYELADRAESDGGSRHQQAYDARLASFSPGTWIAQNAAMGWLLAIISVLAGSAALGMAYRGWSGGRQLDAPVSAVALAAPGFVSLRATLHLPPGAALLRHPHGGPDCLWYGVPQGKRTLRSEQPVMLRDVSGTALMDLRDAEIYAPRSDAGRRPPRGLQALAGQLPVSGEAAAKIDAFLRSPGGAVARDHLLERDAVAVFGELEIDGAQRRIVRHDRPLQVLGIAVEDRRASQRSDLRWGLVLGPPLLALCAWVVNQMLATGFTPWG